MPFYPKTFYIRAYTKLCASSQCTMRFTSNMPCVNGRIRLCDMCTCTRWRNNPATPSRNGDIEMYELPLAAKYGTFSTSTQPLPSPLTRCVCGDIRACVTNCHKLHTINNCIYNIYCSIGRDNAYLLTYPHGTLADGHHRYILRSIQPHYADFRRRHPAGAGEIVLSAYTAPEIGQHKTIYRQIVTL